MIISSVKSLTILYGQNLFKEIYPITLSKCHEITECLAHSLPQNAFDLRYFLPLLIPPTKKVYQNEHLP